MIELSNGHRIEFVAASGALAFDGRGWPWEWPLRWIGLLDPRLFTIVTKTVLSVRRKGNLCWLAPWRVVKFISEEGNEIHPFAAIANPFRIGGVVNAIGLTGPGFEQWLKKDYPVIANLNYKAIVSITGEDGKNCVAMAKRLNGMENIVGIEFNASCPNTNPCLLENAGMVIETCRSIKEVSAHPLILKLSYAQPYLKIAKETENVVEAISINSVPWRIIYPNKKSPLAKYGEGGVSGKVAQKYTWKMAAELAKETTTPVIGPSIWEFEDINRLRILGASAYHFGAIFLPCPWKPTRYIKKWRQTAIKNP
ncbi:MAG: hypothetical protein V1732_05105 [Patescibacteria group bacterium]